MKQTERSEVTQIMRPKGATLFFTLLLLFIFPFPAGADFTDVPAGSPYFYDIQYLEERGIVQEEKFEPGAKITRGAFAKWLLKNSGFMGENYRQKRRVVFFDVKKNNPNAPYIYRLADLGAIKVKKGDNPVLFHPQKPISRKEALEWIFFVEGISVPKVFDEAAFEASDVKVSSETAPLIHKAIQLGLLKPGKVKPAKKLTRAEAARFLKTVRTATPTLTVTILPSVESDFAKNPKYDILLGAWNRIFEKYLHRDELDKEKLMYAAIEGIVKELGDKHSDFERPGNNALLDSLSGEIEGIGAVIQKKDDDFVVVSPLAGSPAEKAGVLAGDIITAVDDVPVKNLNLNEVVAKIRGKRGTQVKLTLKRSAKTVNVTVTRDVVKIVSAALKRTDDNIAIIALQDFGTRAYDEFKKIEDGLMAQKPKGIVIDLRNNPGGFLDKAVDIAGAFVKKDEIVSVVRYPDREETYTSNGNGELAEFKIVVITNAGSASASEILAGALQDYGIAKVIGEKTYGKGTVQELSDFTDGSTLKITVAEWLTPKRRSIEKNGIVPDIEVKVTDADRDTGKDPQMERALAELRK